MSSHTYCSTNRDAALAYNQAGFTTLPIYFIGGRKLPRVKHWSQDDRPNRQGVMRRWRTHPDDRIALLIPLHVVVLDIDMRHGGDLDSIRPFPKTPWAVTGNGWHVWFSRDPAVSLRANPALPGVEVKTSGYTVVPPSVHYNGYAYEWIYSLLDTPLAPLPDHLLERFLVRQPVALGDYQSLPYPANGERWLQRALVRARNGNRNNEGYELASQLRADRLPFELAELVMRRYQERVTLLGGDLYDWHEARDTLLSAYRKSPRPPARRMTTPTPVAAQGGISPSPVGYSFLSSFPSFLPSLPSVQTGIMGIPKEQPVNIVEVRDVLVEKQSDPERRAFLQRMRAADNFPRDGEVTHPGSNAWQRRQLQYAVFQETWSHLFPGDDMSYGFFSRRVRRVQNALGRGEEGAVMLDALFTWLDNPHNGPIRSYRGAYTRALFNDLCLDEQGQAEW